MAYKNTAKDTVIATIQQKYGLTITNVRVMGASNTTSR